MADADGAGTGGEKAGGAAGGKGGKSRLVIIVVGVVLLLGLGGGGAYLLGALEGGGDAEAAKGAAPEAGPSRKGQEQKVVAGGARTSLDTFVVNLADEGAQRYLKVTMMVEFFGSEPPPQFAVRQPEVRDLVLTLLSSKYVADIRTIEGKQQLRDEIIARINRVLDEDVVKAIYFTDFIVQ